MIFALTDLVRYLTCKGRYSSEELAKLGLSVTSHENLMDADFKPGDILILHTRRSIRSWVPMYLQWSPINHVALVTNSDEIFDVTPSFIGNRPLAHYEGEGHLFSKGDPSLSTPEYDRSKAAEFAERFGTGKKYGWRLVAVMGIRILFGVNVGDRGHWRLWIDAATLLMLSRRRRRLILIYLVLLSFCHLVVRVIPWPYPGFRLIQFGVVNPITGKPRVVWQLQQIPRSLRDELRATMPGRDKTN
jgi:hypothetical protein